MQNPLQERSVQLDGLRGLLLVVIAINHIKNPLRAFTYQPFGYTTAAEGFVFLAGLVGGMVYNRYLDRHPGTSLLPVVARRARKIYLYHMAGFVLVGAFVLASALHRTHWQNIFQLPLQYPWQAGLLAVVLFHQPNFFNILPIYCLLLLCLPVLLHHLRQGRLVPVLALSGGLWVMSQLGLGFSWKMENGLRLLLPAVKLGQMDIVAWQLLFVAGAAIATRRHLGTPLRIPAQWLWLCVPVVLVLALHRHDAWNALDDTMKRLTDKHRLAPLRLLSFAALAVIFSLAMRRFPRLFTQQALVLLGRHSLQVFWLHLVLVFLLLPPVAHYSGNSPLAALLFVAFVLACLYALACWREIRTLRKKRLQTA